MKWKGLFFLSFLSAWCSGQAVLRVDKNEVRFGDQVLATIEVKLKEGQAWINADHVWPDSLEGIEMASGPGQEVKSVNAHSLSWTLSVFDTGWVRIPSLPVVLTDGVNVDTLHTLDVPLNVMPVQPDSSGLREIKDIYAQPFSPGYYKRFIPHVLGVALALILMVIWMRRKKREEVIALPPVSLLPHEWAFQALDALVDKRWWQRGEVKTHYSELTGILRGYLERRFDIHALEQTTDEIISQLQALQLPDSLLHDTVALLSVADMIKFAKADPGIDIHTDAVERVRRFVASTMPVTSDVDEEKTTDHADMA